MSDRALFFVNSLSGGGAEHVCLNLAEQLHRGGWEIEFVVLNSDDNDYTCPDYIHVYSLGQHKNSSALKRVMGILKSIPRLNRHLRARNYQLITAHLPMAQLLASLTSVRKKTLYVIHYAQWPIRREHPIGHYLWTRVFWGHKQLAAVSNGVRNELISEYKISPENIRTIYTPIDIDALSHLPPSPPPYPRPYIIYMGRLSPPKKPETVVELYYRSGVSDRYDLVLLGQGPLREKVEEKVTGYGLYDKVFFAGFRKEPYQWLKNAALMLTVSECEALSMSIVEALACGTGVVAANCRFGPDEILTGELAAYLIDPVSDPDGSAETVRRALESYPAITAEKLEPFRLDAIVRQYIQVWNKLFQ